MYEEDGGQPQQAHGSLLRLYVFFLLMFNLFFGCLIQL